MKHKLLKTLSRGLLISCLGWALLASNGAEASSVLQRNSTGPEVVQVQKQLQALGYNISNATGVYDNSTYRAVLAFQRDNHLKINGTVDSKTAKLLESAKVTTGVTTGVPTGGTVTPKTTVQPLTVNPLLKGRQDQKETVQLRPKVVPETAPVVPRAKVNQLIKTAKKYMGVPYKFGGNTPKAFDCSGYLEYVFKENGVTLPRTADLQFKLGKNSAVSQLEPGDLVFFSTYEPGASHCGIYLGSGQFIHASSSKGVRIDKLSDSYWTKTFWGAKHIVK